MIVFAAEDACACSLYAFVMAPGFPTKFSQKCLNHPTPDVCVWVATPFTRWTPPPTEVSPNPIL